MNDITKKEEKTIKKARKVEKKQEFREFYPYNVRVASIDGFSVEKHNATIIVRGITLEFGKHEQGYRDIVKYVEGI